MSEFSLSRVMSPDLWSQSRPTCVGSARKSSAGIRVIYDNLLYSGFLAGLYDGLQALTSSGSYVESISLCPALYTRDPQPPQPAKISLKWFG